MILAAAAVAVVLIAWARSSGKLPAFFDQIIDTVIGDAEDGLSPWPPRPGTAAVEFALVLPLVLIVGGARTGPGGAVRTRSAAGGGGGARRGARRRHRGRSISGGTRRQPQTAAPGLDPAALDVITEARRAGRGATRSRCAVTYADAVRVPLVGWLVGDGVTMRGRGGHPEAGVRNKRDPTRRVVRSASSWPRAVLMVLLVLSSGRPRPGRRCWPRGRSARTAADAAALAAAQEFAFPSGLEPAALAAEGYASANGAVLSACTCPDGKASRRWSRSAHRSAVCCCSPTTASSSRAHGPWSDPSGAYVCRLNQIPPGPAEKLAPSPQIPTVLPVFVMSIAP